jgi:nucleoside-diphosphate-sugar epimerase
MGIRDKKILIAGATSSLLSGAVDGLAADNEVWALGRFGDAAARDRLEAAGVRTFRWDKGVDPLDGLPDDFTHVADAVKTPFEGYETAIRRACVGVGQLMAHCRRAESFLFVSSTAVYTRLAPDHVYVETDPTGGFSPHDPPYATSKIAAEGTVQAFARTLGLPTTIARMNVSYGPHGWGGLPLYYLGKVREKAGPIPVSAPGGATCLTPIHTEDVERHLPLLWKVASVPTTVVNWGGDDVVSEAVLIGHIASLCGLEVELEYRNDARTPCAADPTRRLELIGPCTVGWRDGLERTIRAFAPDALVPG